MKNLSDKQIENIRHSFAHVLAAAVKKHYPKAELGIGPVIENGFYYDFGKIKITDEDLPKIEKEMREIAKDKHAFKKELWEPTKASAYYKKEKQPFKLDLIKELRKQVGNSAERSSGKAVGLATKRRWPLEKWINKLSASKII